MNPRAGRLLGGRYRLESLLGRGGFSRVWRAVDTRTDEVVAVKTVEVDSDLDDQTPVPVASTAPDAASPELDATIAADTTTTGGRARSSGTTGGDEVLRRFRRETAVTAVLHHPNIVDVHEAGVEDDIAWFAMELLPGPTLAQLLKNGPLEVDEVVRVADQVAAALSLAHAAGIVHRDIKPGNIAYARADRVKVLDFGITRLASTRSAHVPLTMTNAVLGTVDYLAPEQANDGIVDGRTDLYALGCVMYALLTGKPPFEGESIVSVVMKHATTPAPDVLELRPDAPPHLAVLVSDLLAKNPDDRPASAEEVRARLGTAVPAPLLPQGEPGSAETSDDAQR